MSKHVHVLSLLSLLLVSGEAAAKNQVQGHVFHDVNGDGVRQGKEPPVPGVLVSNGRDVTQSDEAGRYILDSTSDMIVSVVKPSGWMVPVKEGLPRFHYVHKPQGSPALQYSGVPPTGPLPENVDFPLQPQQEAESFSVLVFGDPQPDSLKDVEFFEKDIIEQISQPDRFAFGLSLGDIVNDKLDLYPAVIKATARLQRPWFYVYGNHDMNYDARNFSSFSADQKDGLADETWERVFGPADYAFSYGQVNFINIDDVYYPNGSGYIGGLREDQKLWLSRLLAKLDKDRLLVVSMHIPLFHSWRQPDLEFLLRELSAFKKVLSLSAHSHMQQSYFFRKDDGRGWTALEPHHHLNVGTTSGSWWGGRFDAEGIPETTMRDGTPNGYGVLSIDSNDYQFEFIPTRYSGNQKGTIFLETEAKDLLKVRANLFELSELAQVSVRTVDAAGVAGPWSIMRFAPQFDPLYLEQYEFMQKNLGAGRRLPAPETSYHFWEAALNLDALQLQDTSRIQIHAEDFFTRSFIIEQRLDPAD